MSVPISQVSDAPDIKGEDERDAGRSRHAQSRPNRSSSSVKFASDGSNVCLLYTSDAADE